MHAANPLWRIPCLAYPLPLPVGPPVVAPALCPPLTLVYTPPPHMVGETRRAPSRYFRDAAVYGHTTTTDRHVAMRDLSTPSVIRLRLGRRLVHLLPVAQRTKVLANGVIGSTYMWVIGRAFGSHVHYELGPLGIKV